MSNARESKPSIKGVIVPKEVSCRRDVSTLMKYRDSNGITVFSIGQIRDALLNRNYDSEIIDKCIVEYLKNKHLFVDWL